MLDDDIYFEAEKMIDTPYQEDGTGPDVGDLLAVLDLKVVGQPTLRRSVH